MTNKKPDWSEDFWHEKLIYQRKMMWREDTFAMLVKWLELRPGMIAADVGCGLGYLGYSLWKYFGENGRYYGIDTNPKLLEEARSSAKQWAIGGEATFIEADAYSLPLPDDHADLVMCQTLLMHLEKPETALAEMVRVAKPGGLVLCIEPDNLNPGLGRLYNSATPFTIEEHLQGAKINLISHQGRIKLGRGDQSIGPKVPHLLKVLGLVDIDVRLNDRLHYLEPPYEGARQQHTVEALRKHWGSEEHFRRHMEIEKEEFVAGGGDPEEYESIRGVFEQRIKEYRRQLDAGEYFACAPGSVYVVIGRKP